MKSEVENQQIASLKLEGFKKVSKYPFLFVNSSGKVFHLKKNTYLQTNKNGYVRFDGKTLNTAKLIIEAFNGQQYRNGQIIHIDGNKLNFNAKNLKYSRIFKPNNDIKTNKADLLTAIRCYFKVEKHFNLKDSFKKQLYISSIIEKRQFFSNYGKAPHIAIFKTYISESTGNIKKTAHFHNLSIKDCTQIINTFLNLLTAEILTDLENRILTSKDFLNTPQNENNILKDWDKFKDKLTDESPT